MSLKLLFKVALGIVGLIVVGALAIQFIPVNRTNPPIVQEPQWDSSQTRALAQRACFDCHSNETVWPWYSYVAPVSWGIADHVHEGRQKLNFSDWGNAGETDEIIEVILEGEMPLGNYLWIHPEARLTQTEQQSLVQGLEATLSVSGRSGESREAGESEQAKAEDAD
jgi:mono/diheme cytochrome c family protein